MTTYTATIYQPGQPAQQLTTKQIVSLDLKLITLPQPLGWQGENGLYMIADEPTVCALLGVHSVDLLAGDHDCAIYSLSNASDYEAQPNPEAEQALWGKFGECEFCGPVLLIEETTSQSAVSAA